jgi:hypothetical protein
MATFAHVVRRISRGPFEYLFQILLFNASTGGSDPVLGKALGDLRFLHLTDENGLEVTTAGLALVEKGGGAYALTGDATNVLAKRLHLFFLDPSDANGNTYKAIFVLDEWEENDLAEYIGPLRTFDLAGESALGAFTEADLQGFVVTKDGTALVGPTFTVPQAGVGRAAWTLDGPAGYAMAYTDPVGTEQNAHEFTLSIGAASTLVYGVDSLAPFDWVEDYAAKHPFFDCWEGLSVAEKTRHILQASRILNGLNYVGQPETDGQPLKWPRVRTTDNRNRRPFAGVDNYLQESSFSQWGADPVPDPVKNAVAAQSLFLARNGARMEAHIFNWEAGLGGVGSGRNSLRVARKPRRVTAEARDHLRGWLKTW